MLENIHIVLVGTTHPGNIGATARAMKTMGLSRLILVQPKQFPCAEATARAAGADDLLANAQVFDNYEESLQTFHLIFATSARIRSIAWPLLTPRECAAKALALSNEKNEKVALVFGREHSGLTNEELDRCHYHVQIPSVPHFSSLNVAAAVQILAYELKVTFEEKLSHSDQIHSHGFEATSPLVSAEAMRQFYQHLEQTLIDIEFLNPQNPKRLMRRLQRLFNKAQLIESELNILRGILTATQKQILRRNNDE